MIYLFMPGAAELVLVFVFFLGLVGVVVALIDIVKNDFEGYNKIVWVLVVLLGQILGAILYYFIGRKQKIKKNNT